ncbi:LOW QUALITY PROTEIN: NB-ARC domain-containing protein, partial [Cephalotus follicularis]
MADPILSVLLEQLTSILRQQVEQEVRLVVGVEKQVQRLQSSLGDIQAVLEDAERRQFKERTTVKQWLYRLKDVSYDMDDVLDEWNFTILKQVSVRRDIALKIKEVNERVDDIVNDKGKFNFTSIKGNDEVPERQPSASVIDVSKVRGRDEDKKTIIDMLLSESRSQESNVRIISIVGMGGIGKTTLAQMVCDDMRVKTHFSKIIWVCVSSPFDEIKIAKAILESLSNSTPQLNELDPLLQNVSQSITGQKFLLVLDDVWTEDYRKFEQLNSALSRGAPGSSILVTTRKETVAKIVGTTNDNMFRLGLLSDKECWSLFSQVAFWGRSSEECKNLNNIGRGIAKRCNGLPLAAKVLGSMLRFKNTKEWESVLESELWKVEEAEKGLFPPLLLSYYDLSPLVRRCFSYCAIFPKDYEMEKDELIKLWMAQGFFGETGSRDMEDIGEECYRSLLMRSLLQDEQHPENIRSTTIKMHDIVHDFAQSLTENECSVMEVNSSEESRFDFPHGRARHLMVILGEVLGEGISLPTSILSAKDLRSLIVDKSSRDDRAKLSPISFAQLTCLRSLYLNRYSLLEEIPSEIENLIHLRYLNLANFELRELPESVSDLINLQSLILYGCVGLKRLPRGLGNLINLRHLELDNTDDLHFMPRGIGRCTSLRTLTKFVVSSSGDDNVNEEDAASLGELENLNHLRGSLEITGLGKLKDANEAKKAQLDKKKRVKTLVLDFGMHKGGEKNDGQVMEAIQPPPNLEKLVIQFYRGS